MRGLDDIEAAFSKVKASAEKSIAGDAASKDRSLEEIFELNNAIGKLARGRPDAMQRMKELQLYVNVVTVGLKHDREGDVREGLALTERSIEAMRKEFSHSP